MEGEDGTDDTQVRVRFVTKIDQYRVVDTPFAVPARLTRYGLSEVINHLLSQDPPVPFDFMIGGVLLRTSLQRFMEEQGLSGEAEAEVEYFPLMRKPAPQRDWAQPDWVSDVAALPNHFVTGCYDGKVRMYDAETGKCHSAGGCHTKAVTCVAASHQGEQCWVASGSKDCRVVVWEAALAAGAPALAPRMRCSGHQGSVEAVAFSPDHTHFASGGWDKQVLVWTVLRDSRAGEAGGEAGDRQTKRRRGATSATATMVERVPDAVLSGHGNAVSALAWRDETTVYSGSWDHSIRQWDISLGSDVLRLPGTQVVTALAYNRATRALASSHPDHCVRLWDPRASGSSVVKLTLSSHTEWVSDLAWAANAPAPAAAAAADSSTAATDHLLVTACYDGSLRVWDVRGKLPLYTLQAHESKALCCAWQASDTVVSGGADNKVRLLRPEA